MLVACGTIGRNGGGWAHYVGQEKIRSFTGWVTLAHALDWSRPVRQCNGTGWFYLATDQWRYEVVGPDELASPLGNGRFDGMAPVDCLAQAVRTGWQVSYPTFDRNPLDIADEAAAAGKEVAEHVVDQLRSGEPALLGRGSRRSPQPPADAVRVAGQPARQLRQGPRVLPAPPPGRRRQRLRGRGATRSPTTRRGWHDEAPTAKLDLLVNLDFRMTSTGHFADVVLPAATWYEKYDLSMTDLHPFVHSFNAAIDPPWEARDDWDAFASLAEVFSPMAAKHLGVRHDVVAVSLGHDTPGECAQPGGRALDWRPGSASRFPVAPWPSSRWSSATTARSPTSSPASGRWWSPRASAARECSGSRARWCAG